MKILCSRVAKSFVSSPGSWLVLLSAGFDSSKLTSFWGHDLNLKLRLWIWIEIMKIHLKILLKDCAQLNHSTRWGVPTTCSGSASLTRKVSFGASRSPWPSTAACSKLRCSSCSLCSVLPSTFSQMNWLYYLSLEDHSLIRLWRLKNSSLLEIGLCSHWKLELSVVNQLKFTPRYEAVTNQDSPSSLPLICLSWFARGPWVPAAQELVTWKNSNEARALV